MVVLTAKCDQIFVVDESNVNEFKSHKIDKNSQKKNFDMIKKKKQIIDDDIKDEQLYLTI